MAFELIVLLVVIAFVAVSGFVAMLFITWPISKNVYNEYLVRTSADKWNRTCSAPDNEEQMAMWNEGARWAEENKDYMKEVCVCNDGFKLFGEYYDFGFDSCAIILSGRCESLGYSYYFAKPYMDAGLNVLVIDARCHGKSDGKYFSIGVYESRDLKVWMDYIEKEFAVKRFYLHGICIGSCSALLLAEAEDCPKSLKGIVLEGCFTDFRESFKQHMIEKKKPLFPVLDLVMLQINRHAHINVYAKTPIKAVKNIHIPILFLFGKKDIFSVPAKSQKLFDACASEDKKLVWFEVGGHSHLRINNLEKYDKEIK